MSRKPRQRSSIGIYHIMLRGADRRIIFADEEDCYHFMKALQSIKNKTGFSLYAYCLMSNHAHLLLREGSESLGDVFRRLGSSYVYYYNRKYELRGHLFQDRFRSEEIEDDAYFLDVLRYIWQNPLKAGLCNDAMEYPWLGCSRIHTADILLDDLADLTDMGHDALLAFVNTGCTNEHLEDDGPVRLTDKEAIKKMIKAGICDTVQEIGGWDKTHRDFVIKAALDLGISIRQFSRLTGISKTTIMKIARKR